MSRGNPNIRNEGKKHRFTSKYQPKNKGCKPPIPQTKKSSSTIPKPFNIVKRVE